MADNVDRPQPAHPSRLLMTHTSSFSNLQMRTTDGARQLRNNITNVFREIRPLVDTARNAPTTISSYLQRSQEPQAAPPDETSIVINLEEGQEPEAQPYAEADAPGEDAPAEPILEARLFLETLFKYIPFLLILIIKLIYDYHESLFVLIILFLNYVMANAALLKETSKRHRRSLRTLSLELVFIFGAYWFLFYVYQVEYLNNVFNFIFIRPFTHPFSVGNLLWVITFTDYVIKLFTVALKILLTMLPDKIIPFHRRGKVYLFIEASSQMYRSIVTIQPWLNYLLESYHGTEKIIAVFLSAFYMISKWNDLITRINLLKTSVSKLLQNMAVGSSPTKEELQIAGEQCPICHDEYEQPVLLHCRHIFCEGCVTTWFDREQTCPLCRAKIVDDPSWRDGSTTSFIQLY